MKAPFDWREELAKNRGVVSPWTLDPGRTALVIIDMQNVTAARGFAVHEMLGRDGSPYSTYRFGRVDALVIPNGLRLLRAFRAAGWPVIHVTVGSHRPDGRDFEPLRRAFDERTGSEGRMQRRSIAAMGTPDHAIIPALVPNPDEMVLNKVTRSAFTSTGIDQILRNLGVTGLVLVGVATNACVGTTACDAADRGYRTVIVEDATAAASPILHEAALLNFAFLFGHVQTTDEVLAELGVATEAERSGELSPDSTVTQASR